MSRGQALALAMRGGELRRSGMTWAAVAAALGVHDKTLRKARKLAGMPASHRHTSEALARERRNLARRAAKLRRKGWPWRWIAEELGVSESRLRTIRREALRRDPKLQREATALAMYRAGSHVHAVAVRLGVVDRTAKRMIRRAAEREAGI